MKDLNPEMVQQFASSSAVGAKTTRNICITLQSMWTTARAWGYVLTTSWKTSYSRT